MYKDLIIIGAGPIGLACAIEAKKANLNYLIIEKGVLVNSLYHFPTNMTFFSTSKLLEIGEVPFISHNDKPTRRESLEYYRRVFDSWQLKANFYERVVSNTPIAGGYELKTNKQTYQTKSIVVAGAANSACDTALELYYKGAEVTMAVRKSEISSRVKYWIKPNIDNRIKEGSITAYFDTTVEAIKETSVILNTPDGRKEIDNDFVFAMTGYEPDFGFLQMLGIELEGEHLRPVHDPETLETNLPKVYVVGVINSGKLTSKLFIENTRIHADMFIGHLMAKLGEEELLAAVK